MLVVGLIGIVMLGTMRLFQDAFRTQVRVEAGQDVLLVTDQLARLVADAPTCSALLKGTLSQDATPVIMGKALYAGAETGRVRVDELRLREVQELTENVHMAKIELRGSNTSGHGAQFAREVPLVYRVDGSSHLVDCLGDRFSLKGNCTSLGGVWDEQTQRCDFCSALGGETSASGRCQLAGTASSSCPMQKAFSANSTSGVCGGSWENDFIGDATRYLGSFRQVSPEAVSWFKKDLNKFLEKPPEGELATKVLGARGKASWVLTMEPPDAEIAKPCEALIYLSVQCP